MKDEALIHVLVINWNGLDHLEACFDSLLESPYANARFVLVDNASEDESVAFVQERYAQDKRVAILQAPRNLGWSGGNNLGIEAALEAGAEYIFLLNNDTATAPDALCLLAAHAEENPHIGALAPKMLLFNSPEILNSTGLDCSYIGASWDKGLGRVDGPQWNKTEHVIGGCGGALFLRSAALKKAGVLPEDFEIYLDDLDLCLRIWDAGYEIHSFPAAQVRHKFSATLGEGQWARHKYFLNTRNRFYIIGRNFPLSSMVGVLPAVLIAEGRAIGRAVLDKALWRILAHVKAWCTAALAIPDLLQERKRRRRAGMGKALFWPLIRWDRMFCPAITLPDQGWFGEREIEGRRYRVLGKRAWIDLDAPQRLRVILLNCYPEAGCAEVRLYHDGIQTGTLSTHSNQETFFELEAGRLSFEAQRIFSCEETGESVDCGGLIYLDILNSSGA